MAFIIPLSILDKVINIDNIDLTRSYVYVLELEEKRYYVGRTSNFIQRMNEHFTENGALYTKKYKPIRIKEVVEEKTCYDERDKTLEYMETYGWENVRGYAWCRETLKQKPKIKNTKESKQIKYQEFDNLENKSENSKLTKDELKNIKSKISNIIKGL